MKFIVGAVFVFLRLAFVWIDAAPDNKTYQAIQTSSYNFEQLIIDGEQAAPGQFPWQVLIEIRTVACLLRYGFCSGSLISNQWVLTAGHCVIPNYCFTVQLGTIDTSLLSGITVPVIKAVRHEDYIDETVANDVGVLKLLLPVPLTANIQPIGLPLPTDVVGVDEQVTISGFGKTSDASSSHSDILYYVVMTTISNEECSEVYGPVITNATLCAVGEGDKNICSGDSGTGAIQYDSNNVPVHVAIASFGSASGCETGIPSGFTRTATYRNWIKANTGV